MEFTKHNNEINLSFIDYINRQKNSDFISFDKNNLSDYSFLGDRQALEILSKFEKIKTALEPMLRIERDRVKAELLGSGVRISPEQFPEIYDKLVYCSKKLGIPVPETFIHQKIELNAFTIGTNEDAVIVLNNGLVDQINERELKFVLGHECGHIQNGHVTYNFMAFLMARLATSVIWLLIYPFLLALRHWSRQAEITADRAGLICCENLNLTKQVMIKTALGSKELFNRVNMDEYMIQLEDIRQNIGRLDEFWKSHPHLPKRVAALELYEKTENYQKKISDIATEGKTLSEIDQKIVEILKIY